MNSNDQAADAIRRWIDLMHTQRQGLFAMLEDLSPVELWAKPTREEWSIGENLDHLRVITYSWIGIIKLSWFTMRPIAILRRSKPVETGIDNVYRRPGFPQNVGWLWPPRFTPDRPAACEVLKENLVQAQAVVEQFYVSHDPLTLGHIKLYDPAIGLISLIQGLRVAVYHDEMHIEQVQETLQKIRS
jgi:hypothetical protein